MRIFCVQVSLIVLTAICAAEQTQGSWFGGPGIFEPVSAWTDSFTSCDSVDWFSSPGSICLDYSQNPSYHSVDSSAGAPYSVVAVNMDGDTDNDLLVTSWDHDLVSWYRNDGNGSSWTMIQIWDQFDGACCARPFDVNDDGFMDVLAAARFDDSLYWFESDSSEYLWIPHAIDWLDDPAEIEPILVNDELYLLACESASGLLHIYSASIQGDDVIWTDHTVTGVFPDVSSLDTGDIDDDGDPDIVIAEYDPGRILWLECISWPDDFLPHVLDSLIQHPVQVRLGDIDRDYYCLPDIAATSWDENSVFVYRNSEHGAYWTKETVADSVMGAFGAVICEIDRDEENWLNLAVAGGCDDIVRWFSRTSENGWIQYRIGELPGATALCVAELDDVGGPEIVAASGFLNDIGYWSPGFYAQQGELTSAILDCESGRNWAEISWDCSSPVDSALAIQVRSSNDPDNMGSWSPSLYATPSSLSGVLPDATRYFQYRVLFNTNDPFQSAVLDQITVIWDYVSVDERPASLGLDLGLWIQSSNPSSGFVTFSLEGPAGTSIRLIDISGRVIEEFISTEDGTGTFVTRHLSPGVYFLQSAAEEIGTRKFIVIE